MRKEEIVYLLLKLGVAFSFVYPAVSAFFSPFSWIGYFPAFVRDIIPLDQMALLHTFGAIEVVIALWILLGKRILWPSVAASVILSAIVLFNLNQLDVLFRDISILAMSLALVVLNLPHRNSSLS